METRDPGTSGRVRVSAAHRPGCTWNESRRRRDGPELRGDGSISAASGEQVHPAATERYQTHQPTTAGGCISLFSLSLFLSLPPSLSLSVSRSLCVSVCLFLSSCVSPLSPCLSLYLSITSALLVSPVGQPLPRKVGVLVSMILLLWEPASGLSYNQSLCFHSVSPLHVVMSRNVFGRGKPVNESLCHCHCHCCCRHCSSTTPSSLLAVNHVLMRWSRDAARL